ncbi:MAG: hypothetical protein ACTHMB_16140 [Candidatus Binatia bacterium]
MANTITGLEKIEAETGERVAKLIASKTEDVARCNNLDLQKPADLGTGLFEFDISALIIILPRLENLPQ